MNYQEIKMLMEAGLPSKITNLADHHDDQAVSHEMQADEDRDNGMPASADRHMHAAGLHARAEKIHRNPKSTEEEKEEATKKANKASLAAGVIPKRESVQEAYLRVVSGNSLDESSGKVAEVLVEKKKESSEDHTYHPPGSHPMVHALSNADHSVTKVGEHNVVGEGDRKYGNTEVRLKDKEGKVHRMELRDHHPIEGQNGTLSHSYPMPADIHHALQHALGKHLESQMAHYKEKVSKV